MAKRVRETDDKFSHKRHLRIRFKRLVRGVMLNQQWLDEPDDHGGGIFMNAKKNVAFLVRQKRKTGILTVAEKAMLRSLHHLRTIEERKKLCMIIANLPCFSNIPPKIRARLVSVLKFSTINTGRVIVKEGDIPIYVYFLVSGEVEMKKTLFDKSTKKNTLVSEAILGSGDWVGEVELLENRPRLNTYVALSNCEVLSITEDEFKHILRPFVRKQWIEKKNALKSLSYFDFLTDDQIVRACFYGVLTQYDPLQSIYAEDGGSVSCVHFILSGECVILQCLKMKMVKNEGNATFELIKGDDKGQNMFDSAKSLKSLRSTILSQESQAKILTDSSFNISELLASSSDADDEETLLQKKAMRKMGLREIEIACGLIRDNSKMFLKKRKTRIQNVTKRKTIHMPKRATSFKVSTDEEEEEDTETEDSDDSYFAYIDEEYVLEEEVETETDDMQSIESYSTKQSSIRPSYIRPSFVRPSTLRATSVKSETQSASTKPGSMASATKSSGKSASIAFGTKRSSAKSGSMRQSSARPTFIRPALKQKSEESARKTGVVRIGTESSVIAQGNTTDSSERSHDEPIQIRTRPPSMETHFIDVGSLTYGAIFGLGEKMAHRVIMARTVVQCLLLPRYWLMEEEQNPGNVWQRRRFYLEGSIPSREELFSDFIKTRRWEKFKQDYVQSTLNPNSVNSTQPEDIPIICRIVETRDDL